MVFNRQPQPGKEPPPATTDKVETVIGANVTVKGEFVSQGSMRIDGVLEGSIEAKGNVIVGEGPRLLPASPPTMSQWRASQGNINAGGRLEITAKGRVWGDIVAHLWL